MLFVDIWSKFKPKDSVFDELGMSLNNHTLTQSC